MGYRNYIGWISKEEYEKIKNFTKEELYKYKNEDLEDGHVGVYDNLENKYLYEFGKYCEFGDKKFYSPFFLNEELQKFYTEEHDFYIVGKEFLAHIIDYYRKKVQSFYKELMDGITNEHIVFNEIPPKKATKLFEHIRSQSMEWIQMCPYKLDEGDEITTSWKYEYTTFELVRIYKTFDWENKILVYYGY